MEVRLLSLLQWTSSPRKIRTRSQLPTPMMCGSLPKIKWKPTGHRWFASLICLLGECFAQIATLYRNFCRTTTSQQVHYARTSRRKLSILRRVPVSNFFLNKDTRAKQRAIKHTHSWPKIHEYETLASGKIGIDFMGPTCFENLQNPFILELCMILAQVQQLKHRVKESCLFPLLQPPGGPSQYELS